MTKAGMLPWVKFPILREAPAVDREYCPKCRKEVEKTK
jgi:hypothetical protein